MQADALRLPIRSSSIDLVMASPPSPLMGVWTGEYWECMADAKAEMLRVLKPRKPALVIQKPVHKLWWYLVTEEGERCLRVGRTVPPVFRSPGLEWYAVHSEDVEVLVSEYSEPGDVVLDPFGGTGSVACIANQMGRIGISSDISMCQAQVSKRRCR